MANKYIGLISDVSLHGINAALVDFTDEGMTFVKGMTHPYPIEIREGLLDFIQNIKQVDLNAYGELDVAIGGYFAQATLDLLKKTNTDPNEVVAIGSHGQTVLHQPDKQRAFTLQIGDPNVIAAYTNIAVIADLRRRDVAEFGQGGPIVSGFHEYMFSHPKEHRAILNIGGVANLTVLPANSEPLPWGFDTGPGTMLLDAWSMMQRHVPFDEGGAWAATGRIDVNLLNFLLKDPYFKQQPPKSTGRVRFGLGWLRKQMDAFGQAPTPVDVQATLTEFTARSICDHILAIDPAPQRILVSGGGWKNDLLIERINERLRGIRLESTKSYGINGPWVDAAGCAWLAWRRIHKRTGNMPSVTGAERAVSLGGLYLP